MSHSKVRKRILIQSDSDSSDDEASKVKYKISDPKFHKTSHSKFQCPHCGKVVFQLPRHLRNVHKQAADEARYATLNHGMRRKIVRVNPKLKKYKDYHKKMNCPVSGCPAVVTRLQRHLECHHKMTKNEVVINFGTHFGHLIAQNKASGSTVDNTETTEEIPAAQHASNAADDGVNTSDSSSDSVNESFSVETDSNSSVSDVESDSASDAAYIPEKKSFPEFRKLLSKFGKHLASPIGKELDEKTISQNISQVSLVVEYLPAGEENYEAIFNILELNKVFQKLKKKKKHGGRGYLYSTIRSIISSLKNFYSFVKIHRKEYPSFQAIDIEVVSEQLASLSCGLRKGILKEKWERENRVLATMPNRPEIKRYIESDVRKKIIIQLSNIKNKLTQRDHVKIMGYLFLEISLDNANRAGEVKHMTLKEYKARKFVKNGEEISVKNHKTFYKYGYASLFLNSNLSLSLLHYVKKIRPLLARANSPQNLFLTTTGNKLSSSTMRHSMQIVWNEVGNKSEVGPTLLRKTAVTAVHTAHPSKKGALATKMNHMESTAITHYLTQDRKNTSRQIATELRGLLIDPPEKNSTSKKCTDREEKVSSVQCSLNEVSSNMPSSNLMSIIPNVETHEDLHQIPNVSDVSQLPVENETPEETVKNQPQSTATISSNSSDMIKENNNTCAFVDATDYLEMPIKEENEVFMHTSSHSHFTHEEEKCLIDSCASILQPGKPMLKAVILKSLKSSATGRKLLTEKGYQKIRNKLTYFKYVKHRSRE